MPLFEPLTPTIQEVVESIQTRVRGLPNFKRDFTWPPDMFLLILAGILGDRHFRLLSPTPGWCPLGRVHANPAASSPGPCCAPLFSPACFPWFTDALGSSVTASALRGCAPGSTARRAPGAVGSFKCSDNAARAEAVGS